MPLVLNPSNLLTTTALGEQTVELSGISSITMALAPIFTLLPIRILPIITAPEPILTLSPIIGWPSPL
jgi:hypothetical protein